MILRTGFTDCYDFSIYALLYSKRTVTDTWAKARGVIGIKIYNFGCQKLSRTAPDPEMGKGRAQAGYRQVDKQNKNIYWELEKKIRKKLGTRQGWVKRRKARGESLSNYVRYSQRENTNENCEEIWYKYVYETMEPPRVKKEWGAFGDSLTSGHECYWGEVANAVGAIKARWLKEISQS